MKRFRNLLLFVAAILFTFHAFAITWSAYLPIHMDYGWLRMTFHISRTNRPWMNFIASYMSKTRNEQLWAMFKTTPNFTRYDTKLEATDRHGNQYLYGSVLPGLENMSNDVRYINSFIRINNEWGKYMQPYLKNAAEEIAERDRIDVDIIRLRTYEWRIWEWYRIREKPTPDTLIWFYTGTARAGTARRW